MCFLLQLHAHTHTQRLKLREHPACKWEWNNSQGDFWDKHTIQKHSKNLDCFQTPFELWETPDRWVKVGFKITFQIFQCGLSIFYSNFSWNNPIFLCSDIIPLYAPSNLKRLHIAYFNSVLVKSKSLKLTANCG